MKCCFKLRIFFAKALTLFSIFNMKRAQIKDQGLPMNKAELVEKIALHTKIPKVQAEAILDATLLTITQTVAIGEDVKLVGFGSFSRAIRKSREGRNPKTGESVKIPGTKVPKFKPGKEFKDRMR